MVSERVRLPNWSWLDVIFHCEPTFLLVLLENGRRVVYRITEFVG